jgi:TRAP-type mannitol/chloroaromatic compound transport system permease small subunit
MNRVIKAASRAAAWMVLPLLLMLCTQWPLREWVQAYSRQTNDAAQIVFALIVAIAVSTASAAGAHLSGDSNHVTPARWRQWAVLVCVLPWALFMLWASGGQVYASVMQFEKFPDTLNPGYWVIKLATLMLYLLVAVQAVAAIRVPHAKVDA